MAGWMILTALAAASLPSALGQSFFVQYSPGGDDTSVQRVDPIVNPGAISAHVHQLFGADGLSSSSNYQSLQRSSCSTLGSAAGQQNTQDKSIYWVPSLYMEANSGGYVRVPTNGHKTYYIDTGEGEKVEPFDFPDGFQMIAGSPENRAPVTNGAITWTCYSGAANAGSNGSFPGGVSTCETYPYFNAEIEFPHCWNGDSFNPDNPYAHVAYPDGDPRMGSCPSTHPQRLPHLFIETFYQLDSSIAAEVKPDSFVLSNGDDTGFGFHADFMSGWDSGAISDLLASCPPMNEDIGLCPNFKGGAPTTQCSLPTQFEENVDTPTPNLPGCNPISDQSPAPKYYVGALGTNSDQCTISSGSAFVDLFPAGDVVAAPDDDEAPAGGSGEMITATINGDVVSWPAPARRTPAPVPASPFDGGKTRKREHHVHRHIHGLRHSRGSW